MSHPNVAIRVAKVAYYNSKISTATNNLDSSSGGAFKNQIFTNGGMRGNFFSQERLPLRSCKIKMKLKKSSSSNSSVGQLESNPELFLSHINNLLSCKHIDKNTSITTQNVKINSYEHLSKSEIRQFFKSLMIYIPNNNTIRLDDLVHSNDLLQSNAQDVQHLRLIYELVIDSKQFGITLFNLKAAFDNQMAKNVNDSSITSSIENAAVLLKINMKKFKSILQILLESCLVLSVGVVERVYVAHMFKQHWVIQSFKNQKGRGIFSNDNSAAIEEHLESDSDEQVNNNNNNSNDDNLNSNSTIRSSTRNKKLNKIDNNNQPETKQFKPVCLIPRPWRYIDGLLNRQVLQKMLETIIIYLKSYPHSSLENIQNHFCPVLQPIMTLELLEMLETLRLVAKKVLTPETECNLFSDFQNSSTRVSENELDDLKGNEVFTYYCLQNSIFNIKTIFSC
jgi:hypothetical protein